MLNRWFFFCVVCELGGRAPHGGFCYTWVKLYRGLWQASLFLGNRDVLIFGCGR